MAKIIYQSRQLVIKAWVMLPLLSLGIVLFDTRAQALHAMMFSVALMAVVNLLVLGLFAHLKITVDEHNLRWSFGVVSRRNWQVPLAQIAQVELCESLPAEGQGIRLTREGMLYNARGTGAVRIFLRDGIRLRIGCADPALLCAQLTELIAKNEGRI
ncbi:MAG: hypothetical protein K2P84_03950 [Undibacterium sp.]|nr:hypothetical protein [Undibacterium sp.]